MALDLFGKETLASSRKVNGYLFFPQVLARENTINIGLISERRIFRRLLSFQE